MRNHFSAASFCYRARGFASPLLVAYNGFGIRECPKVKFSPVPSGAFCWNEKGRREQTAGAPSETSDNDLGRGGVLRAAIAKIQSAGHAVPAILVRFRTES
jgi:hypothetical protein